MAGLCKFPYSLSLSVSHGLCFSSQSHNHRLHPQQPQRDVLKKLSLRTYEYRPRKHFRICACSVRKPRGGRKVKSNVELCKDIREFIAAAGLPEGHVPSMKELSDRGRSDLAHIVRRRGYKFIKDLLSSSAKAEINEGSEEENSLAEQQDAISDHTDALTGQDERVKDMEDDSLVSTKLPVFVPQSGNSDVDQECDSRECNFMPVQSSVPLSLGDKDLHVVDLEQIDEVVQATVEDNILLTPSYSAEQLDKEIKPPVEENSLLTPMLTKLATTDENKGTVDMHPDLKSNDNSDMPIETSANSSFEEQVARFIHNGELDVMDDDIYGQFTETTENDEINEAENETQSHSKITSEEDLAHAVRRSNDASTMNGSVWITKEVMPSLTADCPQRNDYLSAERLASADFDKDLDAETTKREKQVEISHLKFMLHQKELELSQLKEQIKKEKVLGQMLMVGQQDNLALSALQTKAETEISKAQKLISEKDAELLATEESLSGLVEVKLQFCGVGENVEVAGSFNGWHHRIKMDPKLSSSINSIGPRKSRLWSTMLWLYPGVYEIKFIVDGQWSIDPQRESVTREGISNNILRVN